MKLLSWNCRGLGNPTTIRALEKILQQEKPSAVFLMETKLSSEEMRRLNMNKLKYKGCFAVSCEGFPRSRRGGLSMLWQDNLESNLVSYSSHHISCMIKEDTSDTSWVCSGIYGWPNQIQKTRTWELMKEIKRDDNEAWLCVGDFNQIMWSHEKRGGNISSWSSMREFRECLSVCHLIDMGFKGSPFTWSNGRKGSEQIRERLDKAVSNSRWKRIYPNVVVRHLPRYKSDHAPMVIDGDDDGHANQLVRTKFRFEHMWLQHSNFENILHESWTQSCAESFSEQIKNCGANLSQWARKEFGSVRKKKKELTEKLAELQQRDANEDTDQELKMVELELDRVLKQDETMWFQRSRAIWLKDGDRNSAFFHQKASHRKKRNTIKKLIDENGVEVTKNEEVTKVVRDYFVSIFSTEGEGDRDMVLDALERTVKPEMNDTLMKPYTADEVLQTIKQMHPAKAPGPDGMTPLFFQKFWNMIKNDVLIAVLGILNYEKDPSSLNHTHIVLIPKVKNPVSPKDFRPISLCNVVFRIITKTIANRVKSILPDIIADTQSAFIPGRVITDNAMTAFEIFHSMKNKKKGKKGYMAMKLDMSKAYDRVEWNFWK